MPTPAPADFWKLLGDSRLVAADALAELRTERAREAGGDDDAAAIAKWLVGRGVATKWQARRLLGGESGPFFLGDYRLMERLECEGGGRLFRARHEPSGRRVCLMVLDRRLCQRVDVWTEIVRRTTIAHAAVDPLLSRTWVLEQIDGSRAIVCEDVRGETLADELARTGPLPAAQACRVMLPIMAAVAELHRRGAVHGGLSLDAVVRERGDAGRDARGGALRLLQFPLAGDPHAVPAQPPLDSTERLPRLGRRASFVAPELLHPGRFVDQRSDVYALGCMLHGLLTGAAPGWQGDAQRTLSEAAFVGPPPLGPPEVPVEVATLVSYLVARDPAGRYPDAAEAADALARCLGLAPVSRHLPPPSPAGAPPPLDPSAGLAGPAPSPSPQHASHVDPGNPRHLPRSTTWRGGRAWPAGAAVVALATVGVAVGLSRGGRHDRQPVRSAGGDSSEPSPRRPPERPPAERPVARADAGGPKPRRPADDAGTAAEAGSTPRGVMTVESDSLPWASPTRGQTPSLAYLPPGSQLVLLARPAAIAADDEGRRFLKALGPGVERGLAMLAGWCGCDPDGIESVQGGWQAAGGGGVVQGWTVRLREPSPLAADDAGGRRTAWGETKERATAGEPIHMGDPWSFWLPAAERGRVVVVAPAMLLEEMVKLRPGGEAPGAGPLVAGLPQDLESLVGMLDESRHLTLFGAPAYLQQDGRQSLPAALAALLEPLGSFLGDGVQAAAVSVHFGTNFYLEADVVAPRAQPAKGLAPRLARRVAGIENDVEDYCLAIDPHPFGKKLVARLPQMVGVVVANARTGAEGVGVVMNAYLPRQAAHNLVLAAELALVQAPAAGGHAAARTAAAPAAPRDPLERKISLVFAKDTLEKSVQMVADEVGMPIEILGGDLQLEGITKNQSFALDERGRPAGEVLRKILAKSDPAGRLVYVIRSRDGTGSLEITTRAAAEKRGDVLPPAFAQEPDGR